MQIVINSFSILIIGLTQLRTGACVSFDVWYSNKGADFETTQYAIKNVPNPNCNEAAKVSTDSDCETEISLLPKWYFATMCMKTCYGTICADYSKIHVTCIFDTSKNNLGDSHGDIFWSASCYCPADSSFPNQNKAIYRKKNSDMKQYWTSNKCDDASVVGNTGLLSCTKCYVPFIADVDIIAYGTVVLQPGQLLNVDKYGIVICPQTHIREGDRKLYCSKSGFANIAKCVEILNCDTPSIPNAIFLNSQLVELQSDTSIDSNTVFKIECVDGFELSGPSCAQCRFGEIKLEGQTCNPICSISKFDAANSYYKHEEDNALNEPVSDGATIEFVCKEGFAFEASKETSISIQCSQGQFGSLPVCKRKCSIPSIQHLKVPHPSDVVLDGETVKFGCERNYIYIGAESYTCLANGDWNDTLGECRVACDTNNLDDSLLLRTLDGNISGTSAYVLERSHLILECVERKTLLGDHRVDCLPDGRLTYDGQRCGDTCRYEITDLVYSTISGLNKNSINSPIMDQDQVMLICNPGFALLDGTTETVLNCINGTLGFIPQCFRYCSIPNIPFLQIDNPNSIVFEGNAVLVSCVETHEYNISKESVHCCESNGFIQPPLGYCRRKCLVPNVEHGHFISSNDSLHLHPGSTVLLENDAIILQCNVNYQSEQTQLFSICLSNGEFSPNNTCLRECVIPLLSESSFEITEERRDIFEMRPTESELLSLSCDKDMFACADSSSSCSPYVSLSCNDDGSMESFSCKEKCYLSHFVPEISHGEYTMDIQNFSWPLVDGNSFTTTCLTGYAMKEQNMENLTCYGKDISCVSHCQKEPVQAILFASNSRESVAVALFSPSGNGDIVSEVQNSEFIDGTVFVNGARNREYMMLVDGMKFEMYKYNVETMAYFNGMPSVLDWSIDQADTMSATCDSFLFCGGYGDCHACTLVYHDGTMKSSPTDNLRMNACRRHGCSATSSDGDVYIFGGQDMTGAALSSVEVYSLHNFQPSISQFSEDMPKALSYCRAVEHQGMIFVCGIEVQDPCYALNINKHTFQNIGSFVNERKMFEIVSLEGELYALFGKKANGQCEETVEKLVENNGNYNWEIFEHGSSICLGDFIAVGA